MSKKGDFVRTGQLFARELICARPLKLVAAGHLTALKDWPSLISIDCSGAGRNLVMPAEADVEGKLWFIKNTTAATHAITVQDDEVSPNTIQSIAATKAAIIGVVAGVWTVWSVVA